VNFIPVLILFLAVMYLLVIRPQRRRRQEAQRTIDTLRPGVEVLTAGGLYGTIREVGDEDVQVEIAPGTVVRVARRGIAGVVSHEDTELEELERAQEEAEQEVVTTGKPGER
jgi:preprotein translocase subunit YajC